MVFRARDRLVGQDVALKSMVRAGRYSSSSFAPDCTSWNRSSVGSARSASGGMWSRELARLALVHEFRTLTSLRHPNIVSVLDYGVDANGMPYITEELVENAQTLLVAMKHDSLPTKVRVLAQLLRALSFLHRRHIIHCDVKPANILIVRDGIQPEAKLIDFGLAQHLRDPSAAGYAAGTTGYLAPELLAGEPPTAASDLFALGVTATELLCGHTPFPKEGSCVSQDLDLAPLPSDSGLSRVLRGLLESDPVQRYQSASQVLEDLAACSGEPLPAETQLTRGYLLQKTPLIGRDPELLQLERLLTLALAGQSHFALVIGEGGIGKSRLVEELRCQALVAGFLVVHAQAQSEGAHPLHLWREPLRTLCVHSTVDDEVERTLRFLLPDLEQLLGRPLASSVPMEPIGTPHRLAASASTLIERISQPLLLILEDLHLADSASLELLHILVERITDRSVLLVGTVRTLDRQSVEAQFPNAALIQLRPLDPSAQDNLADALVGSAARRDDLRALIHRDAGGHPLFVKEVLRELLAQAGSIEALLRTDLPNRVASGGMLAVLRQRIARVPGPFVSLLLHAAVAGRRLDLPVLGMVAKSQRADLSGFVSAGQELGIIDCFDREWRFSHDLIHEEISAALSDGERESLHQTIAEALLAAYPNSLEQASRLAFHFEAARRPIEAVRQHFRAAEHALQMDTAKTALEHVDRILQNLPDYARPSFTELSCLRLAASANYLLARFPDCVRALSTAETSLIALRRMLRLGQSIDLFSGQLFTKEELDSQEILMLRAGESYVWVGQRRELVLRTLRAFPRLYREPRMPGMVCFFLGMAIAEVGASGPAVRFIELGQHLHRLRGFEVGVFEAHRIRASLQLRQGVWSQVERDLDTLIEWGHQRGSLFRTIQALHMRFTIHLVRNQLDLANKTLGQLHAETQRSGIEEYLAGSALSAARLAFRRGDLSSALERIHGTPQQSWRSEESSLWSVYCCLHACILARSGEVSAFLEVAKRAVASLKVCTSLVWDGDLRILLCWELLRKSPTVPSRAAEFAELVRELERGPLQQIRKVRIAEPGLYLLAAEKARAMGRSQGAQEHLRLAKSTARQLQMPYEEAWASLGMSQDSHLHASVERESLLGFAKQVCSESGCVLPIPCPSRLAS